MKIYKTFSDIGSVLIGNENFTFAVRHGGGDGTSKAIVFDSTAELHEYEKTHNLTFESSARGTFDIYAYDCADEDDNPEIVATLTGRYGIYYADHVVAFEKWED